MHSLLNCSSQFGSFKKYSVLYKDITRMLMTLKVKLYVYGSTLFKF